MTAPAPTGNSSSRFLEASLDLKKYLSRFFCRARSVPAHELRPYKEELVEGCAFKIKHYPLKRAYHVMPGDTMNCTIREYGEEIERVEEPMTEAMLVNTIAVVRFNDSLGFKRAVGAIFGERSKDETQ